MRLATLVQIVAISCALALRALAQVAPVTPTAVPAPVTFDEAEAIRALQASIAGRENEPASRVFSNVKLHGETPAGRLLRIMELGYSRSLGVSCDHCHVATDWASDEKAAKRIARQMILFTRELNDQRLPLLSELADRKVGVNCTTCHRGEKKPALDLPAQR